MVPDSRIARYAIIKKGSTYHIAIFKSDNGVGPFEYEMRLAATNHMLGTITMHEGRFKIDDADMDFVDLVRNEAARRIHDYVAHANRGRLIFDGHALDLMLEEVS